MVPDQRFKTSHPKIISETIDGETIIINLDSGHYFSLNMTGGEIWNGILARRSTTEIIQGLSSGYTWDETTVATSVREFLDNLQREGLISPAEAHGGIPSAPFQVAASKKKAFELPSFQKYDDMQDLLLLDPIHDVDESGWPKTAS